MPRPTSPSATVPSISPPVELKDFAIRTFGIYDKLVLLGSMAAVMVLVAALSGVLSRRSPVPGTAIIAVFGLIGAFAVYQRPDLTVVALLAPVASQGTEIVVFLLLHRLAPRVWREENTDEKAGTSRRAFLIGGAGVVAGAGATGLGGQPISSTRDATASREAIGKLVPARTAPAVPVDADFAKLGPPRSSPRTTSSTAWTPPSPCRRYGPRTGACGCTAWSTGKSATATTTSGTGPCSSAPSR